MRPSDHVAVIIPNGPSADAATPERLGAKPGQPPRGRTGHRPPPPNPVPAGPEPARPCGELPASALGTGCGTQRGTHPCYIIDLIGILYEPTDPCRAHGSTISRRW